MNKQYRIGVLGPHGRGRVSLLAHQPERGFNITAVCGLENEGLDRYYETCGKDLRFTSNVSEIIESPDIDIVFICTPDFLHTTQAIAALKTGKHVFLEKPMAITIADCDRILKAAEESSGRLFVGHNMRYFSVMRKIYDLIQDGRIGTGKLSVYNRVTDRRAPEDHAPRGARDRSIWPPLSQKGLSPVIDIEDHNMLLMNLANGVQACYLECFYTPDYHRNYTIIGTEGRIENYGDHSTEDVWATVHLWNRRTGHSEMGHEVFRIPNTVGSHGGSDPLMIDDFLNFIETGTSKGAPPIAARMAVATGCQGAESMRTHCSPLDIPSPG